MGGRRQCRIDFLINSSFGEGVGMRSGVGVRVRAGVGVRAGAGVYEGGGGMG